MGCCASSNKDVIKSTGPATQKAVIAPKEVDPPPPQAAAGAATPAQAMPSASVEAQK